jgi:iron(III) transport system permease protein
VLLGLIVYPLGSILLQSVFPKLFDEGFQVLSFLSFMITIQDSYTYKAIANALLFGGGTAILTAIFGTYFAVLVHRKKIHGEKLISLFIWLIFFTPSYLVAEGWVLTMQHKGILSVLFGIPDGKLDWFFTSGGLIFAMAFRLFPVVYISVLNGLRGVGSDYEDAARSLGAKSFFMWTRINIPLLFPAILAGATLSFAESVSDFGFASALVPQAHIPLLTYSIFTALNQMPVNFSQVGALSFVLIGVIALALWSQKLILGKGSYSIIQNQIRPSRQARSKSIIWTIAAFSFIIIAFFIPMGGEVLSSFMKNANHGWIASNITLQNYGDAIKHGSESYQAIIRSLLLASGAAVTATCIGIGLAFVIQRDSSVSTKILYVITMSTLAIPGIVLAAGFVFAWNAPYLLPLHLNIYGTLFCVYLAYLASSLPNSIRLQIAAMTQISPSLLDAGKVNGAGIFTIFRKILLPLVAGTSISVLFLIFSHLMFELPASELLYPAGKMLLPVVIVKFYNELKVESGAALTVLSIVMVLVIYGLAQLMIYGLKQWSKYKSTQECEIMERRPEHGLTNSIRAKKLW